MASDGCVIIIPFFWRVKAFLTIEVAKLVGCTGGKGFYLWHSRHSQKTLGKRNAVLYSHTDTHRHTDTDTHGHTHRHTQTHMDTHTHTHILTSIPILHNLSLPPFPLISILHTLSFYVNCMYVNLTLIICHIPIPMLHTISSCPY